MPQLDFAHYPFISQLFWLFASFAILYFYSARVILPRISKTLEVRDNTVKNALADAERIKEEASSYLNEYEDSIAEARAKAHEIIKAAEKTVANESKAEYEKLDAKIAQQISAAEKRISEFKKASAKDLKKISDEIYDNLVKNMVG